MKNEETPVLLASGAVVDMTHSPHARLHPVALTAVHLEDSFWSPRITTNREMTIPAQLRQCEETGRIDNFRRASGRKPGDFQGIYFNDSDVYKWAEAAAYSLATHPDAKLDADLDAVIDEIAAAQDEDGYLNTYFTFERKSERFTNLRDMHEIYCAGHLIQAAVAHHRATGKTTFLNVATKLADCLYENFGPDKRVGACGHEEAEMALVELYRDTGEARYLTLARCMVEARGRKPGIFDNSAYHQDHLPFREQTEFVGHAVRHLYLTCGVADLYAETGEAAYLTALETLWKNLAERRSYITGGAGSRWEGEAFGEDYELPNDRAYAETCAAIASVMWNWRLLNLTGDPRYADLMETTLYNGVLAGLSLDGMRYFYQNPLADRGRHRRQEWFGCACCPPNIARLLASLPGYFYSTSAEGVWAHLYAAGTATIALQNGETVTLVQETNYPWDGEITIRVEKAPALPFSLYLRLPGGTEGVRISVEGQSEAEIELGRYTRIHRLWQDGDVVHVSLPMAVERVESHPHVLNNRGRVALRRGPLVYCIEQADYADADTWDVALSSHAELKPEFAADLLGGITVLRGEGIVLDSTPWKEMLYRCQSSKHKPITRSIPFTAVPYYVWANREAGPMQVWIPSV